MVMVGSAALCAAADSGQFKAGDQMHIAMPLVRGVSKADLDLQLAASTPVPLNRLSQENISSWTYSLPTCEPLTVKDAHGDGSISVADGFFRFRLKGAWSQFAFADRNECRVAAARVLQEKLRGSRPKESYTRTNVNGELTFH